MNELDEALTHLKRLSLQSSSLDDASCGRDKTNEATSMPTPGTPKPQLSMPTDWSKLMTGWCSSRMPTQPLSPTSKEVDALESPDRHALPPGRNNSLTEHNDVVAVAAQESGKVGA